MDVTVKAKPIIQVRNDDDFHYLFNEEDMDTITWMVAQILECDVDKLNEKVKIKNARISKI